MNEEIHIPQNQNKQALFFVVCLLTFIVSIALFFFYEITPTSKVSDRNVFLICILFLGICLIFITKRLLFPKEILTINYKGITDNSSAISLGFISWSEIKAISKKNIHTHEFLCIDILDFEEKIRNMFFIKKLVIHANVGWGYSPVSISFQATNYTVDQVLLIIDKYRETNNIY